MIENDFMWLMQWSQTYCSGEGKLKSNIDIDTLDNPGWTLRIDLEFTDLKDKDFLVVDIKRTENDWVFCKVRNHKFEACGGPLNLPELFKIFRDWVENNTIIK